MQCNSLALSDSKTNFILFHSSKLKPNQSFSIKIDDVCVKQVNSTKYLGVTFDANLTWKKHINELFTHSLLFINGHIICYPHVLVITSYSALRFIPTQHANLVMEIFT